MLKGGSGWDAMVQADGHWLWYIVGKLLEGQAQEDNMDLQQAKDYMLGKPATRLDYPFTPDVMVFKVKDKMFATLAIRDDGIANMNLKCDPDEALALRDIFPSVLPGYHMNKKHWNTVLLDGSIPAGEIERMIDNSFLLVVKGMKKADRVSVELML